MRCLDLLLSIFGHANMLADFLQFIRICQHHIYILYHITWILYYIFADLQTDIHSFHHNSDL